MKLQLKLLIFFLSLCVIAVTVICTLWFTQSKIENQNENTSVNAVPASIDTEDIPSKAESTNAKPDLPPKSVPAEASLESERKKLTNNTALLEAAAFKNQNDIIFTVRNQNLVSLMNASINEQDIISQPVLLEKTIIEENMKGIWNISAGNSFGKALYFTDNANITKLMSYDISTLTKRGNIDLGEDALYVKPLLSELDDRIIYAKFLPDKHTIDIVSIPFTEKNEQLIYSLNLSEPLKEHPLGWMDISNDGKKLLFTSRDNLNGNYTLWYLDRETGICSKLTSYDEKIITAKWSKDGRKIVYSQQEGSEISNIFVYDFNKKSSIRITKGSNKNYSPDWSFYGDKIIYISEEKGIGNLYLINYK